MVFSRGCRVVLGLWKRRCAAVAAGRGGGIAVLAECGVLQRRAGFARLRSVGQRTLWVLSAVVCVFAWLPGCADRPESAETHRSEQVLRLATTTSTRDSGLLNVLLPVFERETRIRCDVIAVGTGKALELGRRGDVDVVLVHAREAEERFMQEGHGVRRE
ncbi:MAG: hypothetical protein D6725_17065, partial [Planctomycetota bacterium]